MPAVCWSQAPGPLAPPRKSAGSCQRRLEQGAKPLQASRWKAQIRLCKRSRQRSARGKKAHQVVGAIARERRAFLWAMAQEGALTPERATMESPAAVCTRFCSSIGRGAAPVWCNPRRRAEAERNPRASSEAGTRRRQGRWEPIHGEQQDQPSSLPGSASSDARRTRGRSKCKRIGNQLLTLEVISTPGLSRAVHGVGSRAVVRHRVEWP